MISFFLLEISFESTDQGKPPLNSFACFVNFVHVNVSLISSLFVYFVTFVHLIALLIKIQAFFQHHILLIRDEACSSTLKPWQTKLIGFTF